MSEMTATLSAPLHPAYPIHVDAQEHPDPSRALWLVKWAAAIPHYIVLALLWVAFTVMSVVAFVAILVTGRYPRAIFDFNVGVLRWSWRVAYYTYGALGTDQYPPFSLAEDEHYPAHLSVDYPEHLSRGLVLVKWWLLALPHYLIVAILIGGGAWAADRTDAPWLWGGGLIGLLTLIAAVVLIFTGRYPQSIYDLVLGLNRWVLRVAAYAGLMTDEYPPFRLDTGGREPGSGVQLMAGPPAPTPTAMGAGDAGSPTSGVDLGKQPPRPRPTGWTAGRVISVVAGALLVLTSLGLLTGGVGTFIVNATMRDSGYITSLSRDVSSNGYAVVVDDLVLEAPGPNSALPGRLIGDVRVRVNGAAATPVFVGIARSSDVAAYLAGVNRDVLRHAADGRMMGGNWGWGNGWNNHMDDWYPTFTQPGGAPSGPPPAQGFWTSSATGVGEQAVRWSPREGSWALVVMNADGSRPVAASVDVGATVPWLPWLAGGLVLLGVLLAVGGALLVLVPTQRVSRERV
jgi:Domain of unknown function (DUF4389)